MFFIIRVRGQAQRPSWDVLKLSTFDVMNQQIMVKTGSSLGDHRINMAYAMFSDGEDAARYIHSYIPTFIHTHIHSLSLLYIYSCFFY